MAGDVVQRDWGEDEHVMVFESVVWRGVWGVKTESLML